MSLKNDGIILASYLKATPPPSFSLLQRTVEEEFCLAVPPFTDQLFLDRGVIRQALVTKVKNSKVLERFSYVFRI
jgi:hypothetical protein